MQGMFRVSVVDDDMGILMSILKKIDEYPSHWLEDRAQAFNLTDKFGAPLITFKPPPTKVWVDVYLPMDYYEVIREVAKVHSMSDVID